MESVGTQSSNELLQLDALIGYPISRSINSLAPGKFDHSLKWVNFNLMSTLNILSIFCEIATRWMPQHLTDH